MAKLCESCRNGCKPWSKELEAQGYTGCTILIQQHHKIHKEFNTLLDEEYQLNQLFDYIDTDQIGLGWINPGGGMCYNGQPLLLDVKKCEFYEAKI